MNKNIVKGTINNVVGRIERQAGEWTGNRDTQVDGALRQIRGKTERMLGEMKDALETSAKKSKQSQDKTMKQDRKDTDTRTSTNLDIH